MNKLVTAIITTHNRQDLLIRAVKSVLCQTYKEIELIVVDDASDDRADEILKDFNLQYIYIPKEKSKGGNHARNTGILAAKGEYVAFLDDDDYWLPTKIDKQIVLIESKKCDIVYCGQTNEWLSDESIRYVDSLPKHEGDLSKIILYNICATTTNILVRKKTICDVGLFDENLRFWQEYELTIRLAQVSPFYFVNEPLSVYRINKKDKNRLTNKYNGWKKAVRYIKKKHKILYKRLSFTEKVKYRLLVYTDGRYRCIDSGKHYRARLYSYQIRIVKKIISLTNR